MDTEIQPHSSKTDGPKQDTNISAQVTKGKLHDKQRNKLGTGNKLQKRSNKEGTGLSQEVIKEKKRSVCKECGKRFSKGSHLEQHEKTHLPVTDFTCYECGKTFLRRSTLTNHQRTHLAKHYYGVKSILMNKIKKKHLE